MTDLIARAVALLRRRTDLGELAMYRELASCGVDRATAARLVEFLPMVYCRRILAKTGLQFPETYRRVLPDGTYSPPVSLSSDALWNEAETYAQAEVAGGVNGEDLLAIAGRCAEFDAANKLLNSGSKLEDIRLTEPIFLWPASGPDL